MVLRSRMIAALAAFSLLRVGVTVGVPLIDKLRSLSPEARGLLKRSTPAAPRFVVYSDAWVSPLPSVSDIQGYNVFALAFWRVSGPSDMVLQWQNLSPVQRTQYLSEYNGAGISMIVSAFGELDQPTTWFTDPVALADNLSSWVYEYGLDGVDVDYEDFPAFKSGIGAEAWLITFTLRMRQNLPQGEFILTHAPVAPWFSPNKWRGGGYLHVDQIVGHLIDWYNVQFYNQGTTEYTTCDGLLNQSSDQWPQSALFQIAANGVDRNKLVIGKPGRAEDVTGGYMSWLELFYCVHLILPDWKAGIMAWEFPYASSSWIESIRNGDF